MPTRYDEAARILDWRTLRLVSAGVTPEQAVRLARTPGFDVHVLLDLLDRGCPLDLAIRISEPVDPLGSP